MALNHLVFTDHGTFRVKADKLTPGTDFFSLYSEGKLVASFTKERVIGIGLERNLPDYSGAKLSVVGEAHELSNTVSDSDVPSEESEPTPKKFTDSEDDYLPNKSHKPK